MQRILAICTIATSKNVVIKALKVSLIVGTVLNLINQGDALLAMAFDDINHFKAILTYLVPYSVTTYTATSMKLEFTVDTKSSIEAKLECTVCHAHTHVMAGQVIPACDNCGVHTHWKLSKDS